MSLDDTVESLRRAYGHLEGAALIEGLRRAFPDTLAVTSSFGAEAAVLLDLVAQVDRTIPVIFLDTDALFDETLAYRDRLVRRLGLAEVRLIRPTAGDLIAADELWRSDPDRCCHLRKVIPLARATAGFRVLVDGRKRYHGGDRQAIEVIEGGERGIIKASPLARWSRLQIDAAYVERDLPRHPLEAGGYTSIGCWPCTRPIKSGEGLRAGRWAGSAKTECGIHA